MTMNFESLHPRASAGKFTDKEQSAPQIGLPGRTFSPGDELPHLYPGTAVDVAGERYFRVVDVAYGSQWLSADGDTVDLAEVTFRVVPHAELETVNDDGSIDRPVATLTTSDTIVGESENTSGRVQRLARTPDDPIVKVHLTSGGTITAGPAEIVTAHRTPAHTYANAQTYWDRVDAVYAAHTDADTLSKVLDEQSEDDFMDAVIQNPNATAELIERASQHHSLHVRRAAVFAENVSKETLERIKAEAFVSSEEAFRIRARLGVSPDSAHHEAMHRAFLDLAGAALQELTRKTRAGTGA